MPMSATLLETPPRAEPAEVGRFTARLAAAGRRLQQEEGTMIVLHSGRWLGPWLLGSLAGDAGAQVIAQTSSQSKAALLAQVGAHEVLVTTRSEDFSERVLALTEGGGVDVLIDNVGTPLFNAMRRSLAINGRWILVGQVTGDFVPFNPAQLFLRNQSMLSVHSTTRAQLVDTLKLIARGDIRPVIAGVHDLEEIGEVHRRMEQGSVAGRIVVRPAAKS